MMARGFSFVPEMPFKTMPGGSSPWGSGSLVLITGLEIRRVDFGKKGSLPNPGLALNAETKGELAGIISTFGATVAGAFCCARAAGKQRYAKRSAPKTGMVIVFFILQAAGVDERYYFHFEREQFRVRTAGRAAVARGF